MRRSAVVLVAILALAPLPAAAQRRGVALADSLAGAGDSAAALSLLDSLVRADRRDAAAWNRLGNIAWGMARKDRGPLLVKSSKSIRLLARADSALRLATLLAPDSGRYYLDFGRFLLNSGSPLVRFPALGQFERALAAAQRTGDSLLVSQAADELGMAHWRRYEVHAHRNNIMGLEVQDFDKYANADPKELETFIESHAKEVGGFAGETDYLLASDNFTTALRADPNNPRALRHAFMALAEANRWEELRHAADLRLAVAPWDPLAWLGRGLASHRLHDVRGATASFDSALTFLSPEDQERYTRLSRILRPQDTVKMVGLDEAGRQNTARLYWLMADPLWLTPGNELRLEFLSRVAYSELRWTSDDLGLKGADTDRGEVHIRYGPPRRILALGAGTGSGSPTSPLVVWLYESGLNFVFRQPPMLGTARLDGDYSERLQTIKRRLPASWDNVPAARRVDSIRTQVARFRGAADSTDIFFVADVPVDSIVRGIDLARGAIDVDFQVYDNGAQLLVRDSTRHVTELPPTNVSRMRAWRERLGRGFFMYRVEALETTSLRGARAVGRMTLAPDTGLAMSDVLVAARVEPKGGGASRWSDFNLVPSVGRFAQGAPIALLWETYGLGAGTEGSRYRVTVTLTKARRGTAVAYAARVLGAAASSVVGTSARGKESVSFSFERQVAAGPAAVDYLSLDVGTAAPGSYTLAVEVTDELTKRKVKRETQVIIGS